ncbi:MAG: beta-lactamase family protein [Gemmatimonadetes bacterium]|nr:beta-lactamase family protein [Gemmatimonadota bacterium]
MPSLPRSRALPVSSAALIAWSLGAASLGAASLGAQSSVAPTPRFTDPDRIAKLTRAMPTVDSIMRAFAERARVPGIAYGVVVDGKLLHVAAAGLREVPSRAAVDTSTVFRIASMTKSFTALAILQLRDAGKLALDDPAEKYVPELRTLRTLRYATSDAPRITVRHLLSHAAGFPEDNPWGDQQLARTDAELSAMMRSGIPFSNTPGVAYEYSNYGFAILGRIVVNVSGMPYARYIREKVLLPLGMTSTTMEARDVPAARRAHGYRLQDGQWLEEPPLPDGSFGAMGGMLTSSADLARWVGLMLSAWPPRDGAEHPALRRASLREMQQVWRFAGGNAARNAQSGALSYTSGGYAYGLRVSQNCLFNHIVAHSGGLPGFGSQMRWLPEYGVGVVALGNLTYTSWGGPIDQVLEALAKAGALQPRTIEPSPVLLAMQQQTTRLVQNWQPALADSIAAMNLYRDESAPRRAAAIKQLVDAAGGDCQPDGPIWAENALRGLFKLRCARGALRVGITLAPTTPARVQEFTVTAFPLEGKVGPAPVCRP